MKYFFFSIFCLISPFMLSQHTYPILKKLDNELTKEPQYLSQKYQQIASMKNLVERNQLSGNDAALYQSYIALFNEYKSFKYDSAYFFLDKAKYVANEIMDPILITEIKIKEGFILLSSGLFKESFDILNTVYPQNLSNQNVYDYYFIMARAYYDLSDYNDDERFRFQYIKKGNKFLKQAMEVSSPNSAKYFAAKALMDLKQRNWPAAEKACNSWIKNLDPQQKPDQYGVAISSLSYVYEQMNLIDKAIESISLAAISDIQNSTKENIALRNLANLLYKKGGGEKANKYLYLAIKDATFYNARHRKLQISTILSIVESAKIYKLEQKNNNLKIIIITLAILVLAVIIFLITIIIIKQLKHKNASRKILNDYNIQLEKMNQKLLEVDAIKQDYIIYFLKATSQLIHKLGSMQKSTTQKIRTKHPEEVLIVLKRLSVKKERENLFHQFDIFFLKLFPSFIQEFNNLFPEGEKKVLKKEELLNTELRIYALYRLGIQNSKQVAEFLEISVATIYSYKTRLKSKSNFKEDFEEKIMAIKKL